MNGIPAQVWFWVLSGTVAFAGLCLGFAVRMHIKLDDAFQKRVEDWMKAKEDQLHKYRNRISALETKQRWKDEDKEGNK
jgi:hypothetical protein